MNQLIRLLGGRSGFGLRFKPVVFHWFIGIARATVKRMVDFESIEINRVVQALTKSFPCLVRWHIARFIVLFDEFFKVSRHFRRYHAFYHTYHLVEVEGFKQIMVLGELVDYIKPCAHIHYPRAFTNIRSSTITQCF